MLAGALVLAVVAGACREAPDHDGAGPDGPVAEQQRSAPTRPPERRTYHRVGSQPYRFENSFRGLAYAVDHGYDWIDLDSNYCWDDARQRRVPLATHWPRIDKEGFDPADDLPAATTWADLTLGEVRRLVTADTPPYRVRTMEEMVRRAAALGLSGVEWEVKPGPAFERPEIYRDVLRAARRAGVAIDVKTVHGLGGTAASFARLRAAKRAGATTMLVNTGDRPVRLTPDQERYVDYVRGPWRRHG